MKEATQQATARPAQVWLANTSRRSVQLVLDLAVQPHEELHIAGPR